MKLLKDRNFMTIFCLFLVYLCWGSTFIGVKIATEQLSPLFLTSIRFSIGGIILLVLSYFLTTSIPSKKQFIDTSYLGVLLTGNGTSAIAYGILYIPSGIVAVMVATVPIWVLILENLLTKNNGINRNSLIGILLGFSGVFLLIDPFSNVEKSIPLFPTMIVMLGCISWAYGTIKGKYLEQAKGVQSVAIQMLSGGIYALIISLLLESGQLSSLEDLTQKTLYAITYLILFGSYVGYSSFTWLMNNSKPVIATSYAFVTPLVALYLGNIIGGESFSSQIILASLLILTGLVFIKASYRI